MEEEEGKKEGKNEGEKHKSMKMGKQRICKVKL